VVKPLPHNQGMLEPLTIIIPEGTILNASYPAATTYGNHLCPVNADAITRALVHAMPDRVTAGWNHLLCSLTTGINPRTNDKYVDILFMGLKGGSGAVKGVNGYDHIGMIDASGGLLDQDYEMFENITPHHLIKHEYQCDSAGPGKWRGGLGVETVYQVGSDNTQLVVFGDGDIEPAFGLEGGGDGNLNSIELVYPDGKKHAPYSLDLIKGIPKGTTYTQVAGGGGGFGNPIERPVEKVIEDVRNKVVSLKTAKDVYKVAIDPKTLEIKEEETLLLKGVLFERADDIVEGE